MSEQEPRPPTYHATAGMSRLPGHTPADEVFNQARRRAFLQDILSPLQNAPTGLLPFEEVRRTLDLDDRRYRGVQDVPLERIVGSVARYHDFNRAFMPRRESLRPRWQRVLSLRGQLPPIDLYKVGEVYFVVDGNHRVSVARQAGAKTIRAHVWEYETRVPVESNDDLNDILIRQEYLEFLEQSHLDRNRPGQRIVFTVPGRYRQLGEEIAQHRAWLDQQHIYTVSFEEAATHWFDTVYMPMVQVIRQQNILAQFPGRTEADLVAYVLRYRDLLQQQVDRSEPAPAPSLVDEGPPNEQLIAEQPRQLSEQAAQVFADKTRRNWWRRLVAWFKRRVLGWEVLERGSKHDPP